MSSLMGCWDFHSRLFSCVKFEVLMTMISSFSFPVASGPKARDHLIYKKKF
jgi:hypothetical protein